MSNNNDNSGLLLEYLIEMGTAFISLIKLSFYIFLFLGIIFWMIGIPIVIYVFIYSTGGREIGLDLYWIWMGSNLIIGIIFFIVNYRRNNTMAVAAGQGVHIDKEVPPHKDLTAVAL